MTANAPALAGSRQYPRIFCPDFFNIFSPATFSSGRSEDIPVLVLQLGTKAPNSDRLLHIGSHPRKSRNAVSRSQLPPRPPNDPDDGEGKENEKNPTGSAFRSVAKKSEHEEKILPFSQKGKPSSASVAGAFEEFESHIQSRNAG